MKTKHHIWSYVGLGVLVAVFVGLSFMFPGLKQFASPEFVRTFVLGFGVLAFGVYMLFVALSVPLPIPSTAAVLAGGYIFGTPVGMVLALISMVAGSSLSFWLSRFAGRKMVEMVVDEKHLTHFNHVFKKRGDAAALISYAIPIFPSDAVSFFLGLTRMSYLRFLLVVFLGHVPRVLLIVVLGADIQAGFTMKSVVVVVAAVMFVLVALFRTKIRHWFFRELKGLKRVEKGFVAREKATFK